VVAIGELVMQPLPTASGEHRPAQRRCKRLGHNLDADGGGDRLGGRMALLGGEATLPDSERSHVARRPDAVEPGDSTVPIGRQEAVIVAGQARQPGSDRLRQRDHTLGVQGTLSRVDDEPAGRQRVLDDAYAGLHPDARVGKISRHRLDRARSEQSERRVLGV
jgi:hypothetical protein